MACSSGHRRHTRTPEPPTLYTRAALLAEIECLLQRVAQQYAAEHGLNPRHLEYYIRYELRLPRVAAKADDFFKHSIIVRQFHRHGQVGVERLLRHTALRVHRTWLRPAARRPQGGLLARLVARLRGAI